MDKEIKREALRQYVRYFRIWFVVTGIAVLVLTGAAVMRTSMDNRPRTNKEAPGERVYDYADVLTDKEEQELRRRIAQYEKKCHADIIIVTINQPVGISDSDWEWNMMNIADDFYDNARYGWNKPYGDGALLLYNWYVDEEGSQKGVWLSTSGKMEDIIGVWEEDKVLDDLEVYIKSDPYRAYLAAAERLGTFGRYGATNRGYGEQDVSGFCGALVISFIVAAVYMLTNLTQSKAKDTTLASTYVEGGVPVLRFRSDDFIRKSVTKQRMQSSSGGGGGGSSHHGGGSHGSHTSSGGHSHGGGGRRH